MKVIEISSCSHNAKSLVRSLSSLLVVGHHKTYTQYSLCYVSIQTWTYVTLKAKQSVYLICFQLCRNNFPLVSMYSHRSAFNHFLVLVADRADFTICHCNGYSCYNNQPLATLLVETTTCYSLASSRHKTKIVFNHHFFYRDCFYYFC